MGYLVSLAPASFRAEPPPATIETIAISAQANRTDPRAEDSAALGARMAEVQAALDALRAQTARMEVRLTELKATLDSLTSAIPATGRAASAVSRSAPPSAPVTVAYRPMPSDGFGDTGLDASPVPVASLAEPGRTLFAVELAQSGGDGDLGANWRALRALHAPLLDALEARVADGQGGRRLLAGPFRNAADAALLCARLKSAGGHCRETIFDGDPL